MNYWIFQANPKHYRIEDALQELGSISWRVPQYTEQIAPGDHVIIWRSGKEAGVVGLGTVQSIPHLASVPPSENQFVADPDSEGKAETRVIVSVEAVAYLPKSAFVEDALLTSHKVVRAPMGTVFPMTSAEWSAAMSLLSNPMPPASAFVDVSDENQAVAFSWQDRKKDVYPLPGGYGGYLDTLQVLGDHLRLTKPTIDEFTAWVQETLGISLTSTRLTISFLKRVGLVREATGGLVVDAALEAFLSERNPNVVVEQLHARCRYIGELLQQLVDSPKTIDQLLEIANDQYECGWNTNAQIQRRRGWLESAEMIEAVDDGLSITDRGLEVLARLRVHEPTGPSLEATTGYVELVRAEPVVVKEQPEPPSLTELLERLELTSRASDDSDAFEWAIRDAFEFLGFDAEKIGGSGKTDVEATAPLGVDDSYRIIIDGKTTKAGSITDGRIDWDTIDDHRKLHNADYAVIAGPEFARSDRLLERAARHNTLLMTVADFKSLLRQHQESPVGLDELRPLFEAAGTELNLDALSSTVESRQRLLEVAQAILSAVEENVSRVGAVTSRDLYLLMHHRDAELDAQQDEIQEALEALASPLIGALSQVGDAFRPGGPRSTFLSRMQLLATYLTD